MEYTPAIGVYVLLSLEAECLSELEFARRSVPVVGALASVLDLFISEICYPSAIALESRDHSRDASTLWNDHSCLISFGLVFAYALTLQIRSYHHITLSARVMTMS